MAEIELKLELSPSDLDAVVASDLFGKPAETLEQHAVYFDTDAHVLFAAGVTLRIRRTGEAMVQTVKATGPTASIFSRSEWETPVAADVPVIDHSSPLLNRFGAIAQELSPQFDVVVTRRVWNVEENRSRIEVAADQGDVVAGDRRAPIREIELELKDGNPDDLFSLARKIEAVGPVKIGVQSKAERGYRLLEAAQAAMKAETIALEREGGAREGFRTIAQSCFRQFRLNESILLRKKNVEALHQARIALRRLRSSFSLFKPLLDQEARRLSAEFRWLAGVLGEARDVDVLIPRANEKELRGKLTEARDAAYRDVIEALGSPRANALMLDFNAWLQSAAWGGVQESGGSLHDFASKALAKERKKLKKHGPDLARIGDERRHEVRKNAKRLRYAAEFFRSLYTNKRSVRRHKRFIRQMEELQDQLGAINDLVTGPEILAKHGLLDRPSADAVLSHGDKDVLIADAQVALDDLLDAKTFWR